MAKRLDWDQWLEEAKEYRRAHGDLQVPYEYITSSGRKLGRWIQRQRAAYEGKSGLMTEDRIVGLNALGMEWERGHKTPWDEMYQLALEFYEKEGHLRVPMGYMAGDGKRLGTWIKYQRSRYNGLSSSGLTEDQIKRLEKIGMCWRVYDPPASWEEWYDEARGFFMRYGHLNVHSQFVTPSGKRLGLWVKSQRYKGKAGLTPEQWNLLDGLKMEWEVKARSQWEIWYGLAEEYYLEHGCLPASRSYVTPGGKRLGGWLATQRERYSQEARRPLSQEQIRLLEELGMSWSPFADRWNHMYRLARDYYEEHGNLLVPQNLVLPTGEKLGRWVSFQRQAYHKTVSTRLTPEQVSRLEAIEMNWDPYTQAWEAMYRQAKKYRKKHGNLLVPDDYISPDGGNLGLWIANQRSRYRGREGRSLSPERIKRLDELDMVWNPAQLREREWDMQYALVKSYWLSHGTYPLEEALRSPNGKSLRSWYYQQRRDLRNPKKQMSQRRRQLLAKIGIVAQENWMEEKSPA